ncbi:hypothetical protein Y717_25230 [Streptomyces scopuliridis RB72]|uniref:Uncharacterized protein n=1 Tax=Streptomyces scopuliridis RB72 TaxID=1440053 RepID=A0A2T7TG43_9ACTN|nr:hypothetical protein Y717_25230 [Streptomyces scopuliridis RB72]
MSSDSEAGRLGGAPRVRGGGGHSPGVGSPPAGSEPGRRTGATPVAMIRPPKATFSVSSGRM